VRTLNFNSSDVSKCLVAPLIVQGKVHLRLVLLSTISATSLETAI